MAQSFFRHSEAATYVGLEGTYGTTPSMTRCTPIVDSVEISPEVTQLENESQVVDLYDVQDPVSGLKTAAAKLGYYLKGPALRLDSGGSPDTPPLGIFLKALLGGEASGIGGEIGDGSTTSITTQEDGVDSLVAGQIVWVPAGGSLHPCVVETVTTGADTITVWPHPNLTTSHGRR
jgi:hypothetical protein